MQPLCSLCLCGYYLAAELTTEAQRTQRVHREKSCLPTFRAKLTLSFDQFSRRNLKHHFKVQGASSLTAASPCGSASFSIAALKHSGQRQSCSGPATTPTCGSSMHQHDKASLPFAAPRAAPQSKSLPQFEQLFSIVPTYSLCVTSRNWCDSICANAVAGPCHAKRSG